MGFEANNYPKQDNLINNLRFLINIVVSINDILKNMISDPKINIQNFKIFALMLF